MKTKKQAKHGDGYFGVVFFLIVLFVITAYVEIPQALAPPAEQPWLTIRVYRDSVTSSLRDNQPRNVGDRGVDLVNGQYSILIKKLP